MTSAYVVGAGSPRRLEWGRVTHVKVMFIKMWRGWLNGLGVWGVTGWCGEMGGGGGKPGVYFYKHNVWGGKRVIWKFNYFYFGYMRAI